MGHRFVVLTCLALIPFALTACRVKHRHGGKTVNKTVVTRKHKPKRGRTVTKKKVTKSDGTVKKGVQVKGSGGRRVRAGKVEKADGTVKKGVSIKGKGGKKVQVGKRTNPDGSVDKGVRVKKP